MLEKIRKPSRAKSIFAYIIFGLICLVFVFLGVPIDSLSGGGGYAALVNKRVISIAEFKQSLESAKQNKNSLNPSSTERQKEEQAFVLNQLISGELIFQTAQKMGLTVSDKELRKQIISFKAFQEKGRFKQSLYQLYLSYQKISPKDFEDRLRKWIISSRVENIFDKVFHISELEKQRNRELNQFRFHLQFVKIPLGGSSSEEIERWQNLVSTPGRLNQTLKSEGMEWVKIPEVTLKNWSDVLSRVVDEDEVFKNVLEQIPRTGIIPKLIPRGDHILVVRLDRFENKKKDSRDWVQNILSISLSRVAFSSWIQQVREKSRIKINPRFM